MIRCPDCDAEIDVEEDELDEGESLLCEECGKNYTVASVDPIELEPEDDDFDDEDFDEDEEYDEEEDEDEEEEDEEEEDDDWR